MYSVTETETETEEEEQRVWCTMKVEHSGPVQTPAVMLGCKIKTEWRKKMAMKERRK